MLQCFNFILSCLPFVYICLSLWSPLAPGETIGSCNCKLPCSFTDEVVLDLLSQKMEELLSEIKFRFTSHLVCRSHCDNKGCMLSILLLVMDFIILK